MDIRLRINPAVFATPAINKDMYDAGVVKAHVYIGSTNHETNNIVQYPSGPSLKAYGYNPYLMDIDAQGMLMPEDAFVKMSTRAYRMQVADLVLKDILQVSWVSAAGSGAYTVSGILAL